MTVGRARAAEAAGMMGRKSSARNRDMAKGNPLQEQLLKAGLVIAEVATLVYLLVSARHAGVVSGQVTSD
jgi:hypothetical protein